MTGYASIATAVQAVKSGADDYLTKPMDFSMLLAAIQGEEQPEQELPDDELLSTDQVEWEHIQRVLQQQDGNISQTAKLLGMHRRTLQRKLSKHRP
jgi:two-component system response regulator RegA